MSVRLSVCINSFLTGRIFCDFRDFMQLSWENPDFVDTEPKPRALYMKT
jgi:hypothetical protein